MEPLLRLKKSILGNPVRLGIMIYLLPRQKAMFKDLQMVLELTPGNLDSHLKTLENGGMIKIRKVIADRPRTVVELTEKGFEETKNYLSNLKTLLKELENQH